MPTHDRRLCKAQLGHGAASPNLSKQCQRRSHALFLVFILQIFFLIHRISPSKFSCGYYCSGSRVSIFLHWARARAFCRLIEFVPLGLQILRKVVLAWNSGPICASQ